jgi:hypothetical protein
MKIFFVIATWMICVSSLAREQGNKGIDEINRKLDDIFDKQGSSTFKVGVSVGMRTFIKSEKESRAIASITPDSIVSLDYGDMMSVVLSSSFTAFPFVLSDSDFIKRLGFTVNINLAEFTNNQVGSVFNKTIDGGMGISFAFGPDKNFALAASYERISVRRPTKFVLEREGKKIMDNGTVITSLDKSDDRYYVDSGLNGVSIKFIFHFN